MKELPEKIDSKFRFVLLAAQRAEQMMRGAEAKVSEERRKKVTDVAMEEVAEGMIDWDYGAEVSPEEAMDEDGPLLTLPLADEEESD